MRVRIEILFISLVMGIFLAAGSVCAQQASNTTSLDTGTRQKAEMKVTMPVINQKGKKGCKCMLKGKGQMHGMMGGVLLKRMTKEQRAKFMGDTVDLRRQMVVNRFDYREALRNPGTKVEDLARIEKKMLEIRIKMLDKLIKSK